MGYNTDYFGTIHLKNKKAIKIIKEMIKEGTPPFDYEGDSVLAEENEKDIVLDINCCWKDYDDEMLKLCLFVAMLDRKASGKIDCDGEERGDIWKIIIKDGKVMREQGHITYKKDFDFEDIKIKKQVYEITKDINLLKEIMVEKLKK